MISTTPLLGYLGKSGTKTNTPTEGDTRIVIPGTIQPTLELPYPIFSVFSAPQGSLAPVNSWIYSAAALFNATGSVDMMVLGPGLWDVTVKTSIQEAGAVSDATSFHDILFFALDGTGVTVSLVGITNKQGVAQIFEVNFRHLVTSEILWQFRRSNVVGLGTGLNIAKDLIIATRLF